MNPVPFGAQHFLICYHLGRAFFRAEGFFDRIYRSYHRLYFTWNNIFHFRLLYAKRSIEFSKSSNIKEWFATAGVADMEVLSTTGSDKSLVTSQQPPHPSQYSPPPSQLKRSGLSNSLIDMHQAGESQCE